MLNFSNQYMISGNTLIDKKKKNMFKMSDTLLKDLRKFIKTSKVEYLENSLIKYFISKKIFNKCENNIFYNPFCNEGELKGYRLFIKLTNICNLTCKHCFTSSNINEEVYFNYEKTIKLIDDALSLGINHIDFTGGEVFTQLFFLKILQYLEKKPVSYSIFSNLTTLNGNDINVLSSLKGLKQIITSMDYFDPKLHNEFRGKNDAYEKTLASILKLKNLNVDVCVNTMIMDDNHDDIWKLSKFFTSKKIPIRFDTIISSGRAAQYLESDKSNINNIIFIYEVLSWIRKQNITNTPEHVLGCGIGKSLLYMHHDGNFMICPGITDEYSPTYNLGKDILSAHKKLKNMELNCDHSNCNKDYECSEGCRMRAIQYNNNINSPDNEVCYYEKLRRDINV